MKFERRLNLLETQIRPIEPKESIEWDLSFLTDDELTQLEHEIKTSEPGEICKKLYLHHGLEWVNPN